MLFLLEVILGSQCNYNFFLSSQVFNTLFDFKILKRPTELFIFFSSLPQIHKTYLSVPEISNCFKRIAYLIVKLFLHQQKLSTVSAGAPVGITIFEHFVFMMTKIDALQNEIISKR